MVPVPKMSPSGWNCAQVRAVERGEGLAVRAPWGRRGLAEGGFLFLPFPTVTRAMPGTQQALELSVLSREQVSRYNTNISNSQRRDSLQQPEVSSVTLVSTRPVWMSEKAQY